MTWQLPDSPSIDIGVAGGDEHYELEGASGSLLMADGRILVANSASNELRVFDGGGEYLRAIGRKGEGPGEFSGSLRVIRISDTSFAVFDQGIQRVSVFDSTGTLLRESRVTSAGTNDFPLWVWLHGRAWIVGPADTMQRFAIAATLATLPEVPAGAYRYVHVAADGKLWTQDRLPDGQPAQPFAIYSRAGVFLGQIMIPGNTEIHQIGRDFILLRHWGGDDVEHIRLYRISQPHQPPSTSMRADADLVPASAAGADAREELAVAVRGLVMAQEMFYMEQAGYADDATELQWKGPEEAALHLMTADKRGWVGVLAHRTAPILCGMAVGGSTPPGWTEGRPTCSPPGTSRQTSSE